MSETDNQLRQLFIACDTDGSGFIGNDEVRDICAKFGIAAVDADSIFEDLDRDGDGKISFEDFQEGFDDYEKSILVSSAPLSPGFRRNADSLESIKKALEQEAQIRNTEKLRNKKAGELPEKTPLRYALCARISVALIYSSLSVLMARKRTRECSCSSLETIYKIPRSWKS